MRLDHVSYVASHDQISDTVNRIGSQIGTAFIDGGIHPRFGTRNFTAPLLNGQYVEIVCPIEHPATDNSPFGTAVRKKAGQGGGWLSWIIATNDINEYETLLKRQSVVGERKKPDGKILTWKQIGVLSNIENAANPFFVEWISKEHPSLDGEPSARISKISILANSTNSNLLDMTIKRIIDNGIDFIILNSKGAEYDQGITKVDFLVNGKIISIT